MTALGREIHSRSDIEALRREASALARTLGASEPVAGEAALIVSELGTNLLRYARHGSLAITTERSDARAGIRFESRDQGPGIADVGLALTPGYSSGGGLGQGLPMVERLAGGKIDLTTSNEGTTIVVVKWLS